jgi:superfamily I DNA/RNA helicase
MTPEEYKEQQKTERVSSLKLVLASKNPKKVIVAGAGTGKTHTFRELLNAQAGKEKLAITFIRKLQREMETALGESVTTRTFHSFCKGLLHEQQGGLELAACLDKVIETDATELDLGLADFHKKFQTLATESKEVSFYMERAKYYGVHGFDHSVYCLYQEIKKDSSILPAFDQIVVDEFQDFNPLEVAFIEELSKKGPILIVGDDDQAVYPNRSASPDHLRKIYADASFDKFTLPFCSRCPPIIVEATKKFIAKAVSLGHLNGRIAKPYECFLPDKEADGEKYPKIRAAHCQTASSIPKYIEAEIKKIVATDIERSWTGDCYPTVLVIGQRQYLAQIYERLKDNWQVIYSPGGNDEYGIVEAYEALVGDKCPSFGWRIIAEVLLPAADFREVLVQSSKGAAMIDLLPAPLRASHSRAVDLIRFIKAKETSLEGCAAELKSILADHYDVIVGHFFPTEDEAKTEPDKSKPSVLLTSMVGSKGLSAGHVFIVGMSDESFPRDPAGITDVEISQFIVALTRTRNQCHLVSCDWFASPKNANGEWIPKAKRSTFISWLPPAILAEGATLSAKDFQQKKNAKEKQ